MKKMLFWTGAVILWFFSGCGKVKDLANINVDIPYTTQVTVPQVQGDPAGTVIPGGLSLSFPAVAVPTNAQQYMDEYHTNGSMIVSVDLTSLSLQILMPVSQNFDFLDTVQLYISAPSLPEMLVAYQYNVAKNQNNIDFVTTGDVNLKNYFVADTMYFRMRTHINAVPASGTTLNIAAKFHMLANPLD